MLTLLLFFSKCVFAQIHAPTDFDRIHVVAHQIDLLKKRTLQSELELQKLQPEQHAALSSLMFSKANKPFLDKLSLDVSVAESNLQGVNIEFDDAKQMIYWLEKNVQELENQINLLSMFKLKSDVSDQSNIRRLSLDLSYQRRLLRLEKTRLQFLSKLKTNLQSVLQVKRDKVVTVNEALKSNKMLQIKQKEVRDELDYQEQQQYWLTRLDSMNSQLIKLDLTKNQDAYIVLEHDIFYANEKASYAYTRSLLARYNDQIQQMHAAFMKSSSINLFSEISSQLTTLKNQVDRIDDLLNVRNKTVSEQLRLIEVKNVKLAYDAEYTERLQSLKHDYDVLRAHFNALKTKIADFRLAVDQSLQKEISARQGFPSIGVKTFLDIGREILLVPALSFQMLKTLSIHVMRGFQDASASAWLLFAAVQCFVLVFFMQLRRFVNHMLSGKADWHNKVNSKWLIMQIIKRHFYGIFLLSNTLAVFLFLAIPMQGYGFIFSLMLVYLVASGLMTISRLCLVETTHDTTGHDVRLFKRLHWLIWAGGVVTFVTVFMHQLPLVYELKLLCDRLFLLSLMLASLMILRSWHVVPNLIVTHMDKPHPYIEKCVWTVSILVPALIFFNSVAGLIGYLNLVVTYSRYEGIFILVLLAYIILRGFLSDLMLQASRLIIQHVANGWLWSEAFLKPLDKILHVSLFLGAWAMLFVFYGWNKDSTIVVSLGRLLHYQLMRVLGTTITPLSIIALFVIFSVFYWTAKWTREFVYRALSSRTTDMGIRNSMAILSQYLVIAMGIFISLRVLGVDWSAVVVVASMFAFGIGLGLRDLANNFASGFFLLLERPVRVGDLVNINGTEGEVIHIGSRAVTVRTWDHVDMLVPNVEIFNKAFTNWTARDDVVRSVLQIKISRHDNPHHVMSIIESVLAGISEILLDPQPNVYLKDMSDTLMEFEVRYYVNVRKVVSLMSVKSKVLIAIWDSFEKVGIKPPFPQSEIFIRNELSSGGITIRDLIEPQPQA